MKHTNTSFIIMSVLAITCTKKDAVSLQAFDKATIIETNKEIPLNDLGAFTYKDSAGGLYPGGTNEPSGEYATYLMRAAQNIIPIDTFGNPSTETGNIIFISMGGSTGGQNMKSLKSKTTGNPRTNPKLRLISCNNGSGKASLSNKMNTASSYWSHVKKVITDNQSSQGLISF